MAWCPRSNSRHFPWDRNRCNVSFTSVEELATPDLQGGMYMAYICIGRTSGVSSICSSSPVYKGDQSCYVCTLRRRAFLLGKLFSGFPAACLLCAVPPQHFYLNHLGHLEVTGKSWSKGFEMARFSLSLMSVASAEVSVGPTLADFLIYMSVDYSNRIMC